MDKEEPARSKQFNEILKRALKTNKELIQELAKL